MAETFLARCLKPVTDQDLVTLNCMRSLSPSLATYSINNTILQIVEQHKYLGVILQNSMSWSKYIQDIINKASKMQNFVK